MGPGVGPGGSGGVNHFNCVASGVPWDLVLPDALLGIHGSCVVVPCRFTVPEQLRKVLLNCSRGGIWRTRSMDGPFVIGPDVKSPQVAEP